MPLFYAQEVYQGGLRLDPRDNSGGVAAGDAGRDLARPVPPMGSGREGRGMTEPPTPPSNSGTNDRALQTQTVGAVHPMKRSFSLVGVFQSGLQKIFANNCRTEQAVALLMVAVGAWTTLVNIRGDYTIHFIDNAWPLNPGATLRSLIFAWDPQQLGYLNLLNTLEIPLAIWCYFLQILGVPSGIQEILTLTLLQAIAGFFLFLIFHRFFFARVASQLRVPLAFFSALGSLTNFGVQTVYWWDFIPYGFEMLAFGSVFLYLTTIQMEDYLNGLPFRAGRVGTLAAFGVIAFSVNIPFNLSLLALSFLIPPLALSAKGVEFHYWKRVLGFETMLAGLIVLVSLWWLIPSIEMVQLQPTYVLQQSPSINSLAIFVNSTARDTLVTVFEGAVGYPLYATGHFLLTAWFVTYIAPGLAVLPVSVLFLALFCPHNSLHRSLLYVMCGVLGLSLIVTGVNSPLYPIVFSAIFQTPVLLDALRTPFVALGESLEVLWVTAISLAYAMVYEELRRLETSKINRVSLMHRYLSRLPNRRGAWRYATVMIAAIIVLSPIVAEAPGAFAGDAVPLSPYQSRMAIPPYEEAVANYLRDHLHGQFALLYPGGFLEQNWTHGYDGYDVLPSLLPGQFLIDNYQEGFVVANNTLLTDAYTTLQSDLPNTANYSQLLTRLGVRYLVIEGGIGGKYPFGQSSAPDYSLLLGALNKTVGLTLAITIGPDFLYEVESPTSLFSLATHSMADSNLLESTVAPEINLTRAFFNASQITTPFVPYQWLFPTWQDGILYDATPSVKQNITMAEQENLASMPSELTLFNGVPLNIHVAAGDYLILSFTTNNETAISVTLVTTPYLANASKETLQANSFPVGGAADNLGQGDNQLVATYGANHFDSFGKKALLIDDLSESLHTSVNRTIYYILISLWPVLPNGTGIRELPPTEWPGNQEVTVTQLELGRDIYLSPPNMPLKLFGGLGRFNEGPLNLTNTWFAGVGPETSYAPADILPAQLSQRGDFLSLNASLREAWENASGTTVAQAFGEPTWFNSNLLGFSPAADPFLALNVTSAFGTAFSAAVVPQANITAFTSRELESFTTYLGGAASNQGEGDPLLIPAYGAKHYVSNSSSMLLVDNLERSLTAGVNHSAVNHIFLSVYYVLANGSGVRGLSVTNWTGTQQLVIRSLSAAPYLWRGQLPSAIAINLSCELASNQSIVAPLTSNTVVLHSSAQSYARNAVIHYIEVDPTDFDVTVTNSSGSPIVGDVLVVFDQTFYPGWEIVATEGVSSWSHVVVDASLNGFLIIPQSHSRQLVFSVQFKGQEVFVSALMLGFVVPPTVGFAAWAIPRLGARWRALTRRFSDHA